MESSQKILKELSDLTRNLDVFTRGIKSSNKEILELQKSAAKIAESPVKKTENSAKKSAVETRVAAGKPPEVASVPIKTDNPAKKSGLEAIKAAGASFLRGGSLKDSAKSGASEGGKNLASAAIRGASVQTRKDELKEKERLSPVEKKGEEKISPSDVKEKKSPLEKINSTGKKKDETPAVQPERKTENKGFFASLLEKISRKKEETKKDPAAPPTDSKKLNPDGQETPRKRGFLSSLLEMRRKPKPEEQDIPSNETPKAPAKKVESPSAVAKSEKTPSESILKSPSITELLKIKEKAEGNFGNPRGRKSTVLGGLVKKTLDKIIPPREGRSEMKKEGQSLKAEAPKSAPAPPDPVKSQSETMPSNAQSQNERPKSPDMSTPAGESSPQDAKKSPDPTGKPAEGITPQDIQDIKSLLSSISSTLSGPLTIKDNKPFRPRSNMLD